MITSPNSYAGVPGGVMPSVSALRQNRPNPFGAGTAIGFDMPRAAEVRIEVLDVNGRVVRSLLGASSARGTHSVEWDGRDVAGRQASPGIYFVRMMSGEFKTTRKMVLMQ